MTTRCSKRAELAELNELLDLLDEAHREERDNVRAVKLRRGIVLAFRALRRAGGLDLDGLRVELEVSDVRVQGG